MGGVACLAWHEWHGMLGVACLAWHAWRSMLGVDCDTACPMLPRQVSLDEFTNWINCTPQRRNVARGLSLASTRATEGGTSRPPLSTIQWTPSVLRDELQSMLMTSQVCTVSTSHDLHDLP